MNTVAALIDAALVRAVAVYIQATDPAFDALRKREALAPIAPQKLHTSVCSCAAASRQLKEEVARTQLVLASLAQQWGAAQQAAQNEKQYMSGSASDGEGQAADEAAEALPPTRSGEELEERRRARPPQQHEEEAAALEAKAAALADQSDWSGSAMHYRELLRQRSERLSPLSDALLSTMAAFANVLRRQGGKAALEEEAQTRAELRRRRQRRKDVTRTAERTTSRDERLQQQAAKQRELAVSNFVPDAPFDSAPASRRRVVQAAAVSPAVVMAEAVSP